MSRPARRALALTLALAGAWTACGERRKAAGPAAASVPGAGPVPIVVISIDTLRSDRLPAYGYAGVETPAIDALRRDAVLFERAYSHTPLTLPSHVSMLTGLLPASHGVRDNQGYSFAPGDGPWLPRDLRRRGYATGAAVSAAVLAGSTGLDAGFDVYDDRVPERPGVALGGVARPGSDSLSAIEPWLRSVSAEPFFLLLHLFEPHLPYDPPEPFASRYPSGYDGEIAAADRVVGELLGLLRELGVYEDAAIVLLSDHGEGLGDHGEEEHGIFLYREALQVPLLVKLPGGARAGERVASPVGLIDLYPTVLELTGGQPAAAGPGVSLLRAAEVPAAGERAIYAETFYPRIHYGWSELRSLVRDRHHYIEAPRPELYDLEVDPGERHNLVRRERQVAAELRRLLAARDGAFEPAAAPDEETRRRLAALGYLGGSARDRGAGGRGPGEGGTKRPDPKDRIASLTELRRGFDHYRRGEWGLAVPAFEAVLAENPGIVDGWEHLALSLRRLGRLDEAAAAYRAALAASVDAPHLLHGLAAVELDRRRLDVAREALARAGELGAPEPRLMRRLGLGLARSGRFAEAVAVLRPLAETGEPEAGIALARTLSEGGDQAAAAGELERLLARIPGDAAAAETLGLVRLRQQRWQEAHDASRRAVEIDPGRTEAWNNLGVALYSIGRKGEAVEAWQRAVDLDPDLHEVLYNLGTGAAELGRVEQARRALSRFVATAPPERYAADLRRARSLLARLPE